MRSYKGIALFSSNPFYFYFFFTKKTLKITVITSFYIYLQY